MANRRDWTAARAKVEADNHGRCRVCKTAGVDAAHVIPRSINPTEANMGADAVTGLCRRCHTEYDSHQLDLLPYLTLDEQVHAVRMAGSLERARRIITGERL
jgi:hypothetical protein